MTARTKNPNAWIGRPLKPLPERMLAVTFEPLCAPVDARRDADGGYRWWVHDQPSAELAWMKAAPGYGRVVLA